MQDHYYLPPLERFAFKMGLPEILDRRIPRHGTQRGRSWGWTAGIGRAYIVTEGDHWTVAVETSLKGMQHTLSRLTAQGIALLDFRDDRLRIGKTYWTIGSFYC